MTTYWIKIEYVTAGSHGERSVSIGPFYSEEEMREARASMTFSASKDIQTGERTSEAVEL